MNTEKTSNPFVKLTEREILLMWIEKHPLEMAAAVYAYGKGKKDKYLYSKRLDVMFLLECWASSEKDRFFVLVGERKRIIKWGIFQESITPRIKSGIAREVFEYVCG